MFMVCVCCQGKCVNPDSPGGRQTNSHQHQRAIEGPGLGRKRGSKRYHLGSGETGCTLVMDLISTRPQVQSQLCVLVFNEGVL